MTPESLARKWCPNTHTENNRWEPHCQCERIIAAVRESLEQLMDSGAEQEISCKLESEYQRGKREALEEARKVPSWAEARVAVLEIVLKSALSKHDRLNNTFHNGCCFPRQDVITALKGAARDG